MAAVVSTITGVIETRDASGLVDGASIMLAIVIICLVTAGNNYAKEK